MTDKELLELAAKAAGQAATLATVTPLVQLALEEIDDGREHAEDCMKNYGSNYHCKCQKPATLAKLRAFLSGATKGEPS